jgi:hypothetical protein
MHSIDEVWLEAMSAGYGPAEDDRARGLRTCRQLFAAAATDRTLGDRALHRDRPVPDMICQTV